MWTELETKYNDREPYSNKKIKIIRKRKSNRITYLSDKCNSYKKYCVLTMKKSSQPVKMMPDHWYWPKEEMRQYQR